MRHDNNIYAKKKDANSMLDVYNARKMPRIFFSPVQLLAETTLQNKHRQKHIALGKQKRGGKKKLKSSKISRSFSPRKSSS